MDVLGKLIARSKQSFLIPFYHIVSDKEDSLAKYLYPPRKVAVFKRDLDVLLTYYTPVTLHEFKRLASLKTQPKKPYFHLTFDDGLSSFYETVAPILEEKKIPATIFLNTDFIGNKALFYRYKASLLIQFYEEASLDVKNKFYTFFNGKKNIKSLLLAVNYANKNLLDALAVKVGYSFELYLKKENPYVTSVQIKDLIDRGFTIGAHSKDHPLYAEISLESQIAQTQESLVFLRDHYNINYNVFSFPFNDLGVKKTFFSKMESELSMSFGTAGIKEDRIKTNFHRLSFELADTNIKNFLIKEYIKYFIKIPLGKNIMPRD